MSKNVSKFCIKCYNVHIIRGLFLLEITTKTKMEVPYEEIYAEFT